MMKSKGLYLLDKKKIRGVNIYRLYLVLIAVIFFTFSNLQANQCQPLFEDLIDLSRVDYYHVHDPANPNLKAEGRIIERELYFGMYTRTNSGERAPGLYAKEQFDRMLKHLEGQFDVIVGVWTKMENYQRSDNLYQFNRAIDRGLSPEEAARETWTAKQAARHGYTEIGNITLEGRGWHGYEVVMVEFLKPGHKSNAD